MFEWVKCEYGKSRISRAGLDLVPWWTNPDAPTTAELAEAYHIVQQWRTSHALPLNVFKVGLRRRARRVEPKAIVAERLKRFSSVMNKLAREPHMSLSQMQDLGGCRAILPDISGVYRLYEMYRGGGSLFDEEGSVKCKDYIAEPKDDGYRSVHVVGRYSPREESREPWNGFRIEIQLRTKLQHAFATAVETVTAFTREPLKFGAGSREWARFFSLMGSALALREGTATVDGTPDDIVELSRELREISGELMVHSRLQAWANAIQQTPQKHVKRFKWLLLLLNTKENSIQVSGYSDRSKADRAIAEIERSKEQDLDAVLVWVKSIKQLKAAYPNYYADTREFIHALNLAMKGQVAADSKAARAGRV